MKRELKAAIAAIIIICFICLLVSNAPRTGPNESILLEEEAVVAEINLYKREVKVQIEKLNSYYDGLKLQPYDSVEVTLSCKWMKNSILTIKDLNVSDKIIYTHYDNKPYRAEGIDVLYSEKAVIKEIFLYQNKIKVEIAENSYTYNSEEGNPYVKKEIMLDCSHMIQGKKELDLLDKSDEIVFTHFYDTPYEIKTIKMED